MLASSREVKGAAVCPIISSPEEEEIIRDQAVGWG